MPLSSFTTKRIIERISLRYLIIGGIILLMIAVLYIDKVLSRPLIFSEHNVQLPRGGTLNDVTQQLYTRGIIQDQYSLRLYARLKGADIQIKAGEYRFKDGTNQKQLLDKLIAGKDLFHPKLTIIEGWTFKQMRDHLNNIRDLRHDTAQWTDQQIMAALGMPNQHPEGRFSPDTYHYYKGDSDLEIFKKSYVVMENYLDQVWKNRKDSIQLKDKHQALILASIIEKETQELDEQPIISGVFDNRLRLGMRLQADPTVIYGLGEDFDGNIKRKHLRQRDNPYNTYRHGGLPPTPISLPGHDALQAAVNPMGTEFLYFVVSGNGRHVFSKTLKQHNLSVKEYIRKKKSD